MNRADFQQLAKVRIEEARVLLDSDCYEGAYYLAGYAVECALKACIAKQTKRYDFPDKRLATKAFTHNLEELIKAAKLDANLTAHADANSGFEDSWNIVKGWSEEARYEVSIPAQKAQDLYSAITHRKEGVLTWLKKYW